MNVTSGAQRLATSMIPVVMAVAACGGGSPATEPSSPAAVPPAATALTGSPRTAVDDLKITATDFAFASNLTAIHPGAPGVDVFFENKGAAPHTVTFYTDPDFKTKLEGADSGTIAAGQSTGFPFSVPTGVTTVYYRCEVHPSQMKGQLTVG